MARIKGIDVVLIETVVNGEDEFGAEILTEREVIVSNVLVAPASSTDITDSTQLYGRTAVYTLAIPKGDNHNWENKRVRFFDNTWKTFGIPQEGIESLIPLDWNKKVMVERYNG
nr:MAG TPA: Minor capsid protein [Caudoviricetes sp.]